MVLIKYKPYPMFGEEVNDSELETVVSGENYQDALENLVAAINADEIDEINNELVIVEEEEDLDAKGLFYVDIPEPDKLGEEAEWTNVTTCDTKREAIKYVNENIGFSTDGSIQLISGAPFNKKEDGEFDIEG